MKTGKSKMGLSLLSSVMILGAMPASAYSPMLCNEQCNGIAAMAMYTPGTGSFTTAPISTSMELGLQIAQTTEHLKMVLSGEEIQKVKTANTEAHEVLTQTAKVGSEGQVQTSENFQEVKGLMTSHLQGRSINGKDLSSLSDAEASILIVAMNADQRESNGQ